MAIPDENSSIVSEINECIQKYSLAYSPTFDVNDFQITDNIITNSADSSKLSDLILDNFFPQNPIPEYHHFTDIDAFESIIQTQNLWLFSVKKRFTENEFKPFYDAHKMDGYESRKNSVGNPIENDFVENTFYTSFTNNSLPTDAEANMWKCFAKDTGVRLVFEVESLNIDFRQVYYPQTTNQQDITLLTELIELAKKRNKYLIIKRISTIGFFYLPYKYKNEQEYRILVKRETGKHLNLNFGSERGFDYLEFPLDETNPLAYFKLKKIIISSHTDENRVRNIIHNSMHFNNTSIEKQLVP